MKVRNIDFNPTDWLEGTRGIGIDETATYWTVCALIYARDGRCPNDVDFIVGQLVSTGRRNRQSVAGATKRVRAALARLIDLDKLHVSPDGQWLTNGRADVELGRAQGRIIGAARAGIASGKARQTRALGSARSMHRQRTFNAPSSPSQSSKSNGLARTSVRNHQPPYDYESDTKNITDAARDPAPEPQAAPGRAHPGPEPTLPATPFEGEKRPPSPARKTADRLAEMAAAARAKLLRGER